MWNVFSICVKTDARAELGLDGDGGDGKGSETFIVNEGTQGDSKFVSRIRLWEEVKGVEHDIHRHEFTPIKFPF